jgi:hypothetical protein
MKRLNTAWRIRLGAVAWFLAGLAFLLAAPVLLQAWPPLLLIVGLIAALLALLIAWLWRRLKHRQRWRGAWAQTAVGLVFLLTVLLAAPIYVFAFYTQYRPALVPQVTLVNGDRTIVIQGMQHVGADRYFRSVVFDLEQALAEGYVLFYEGVRPSTPEIDAWFDQAVTDGQDLTTAYREIGDVCGLRFQSDYLNVLKADEAEHPGRHVVADVSTADLKAEYDRLVQIDPSFATAVLKREAADSDGLETVVSYLNKGTSGQKDIAGVICRGFMTMVMSRSNDPSVRDDLDPLILDYRNRVLASRLIDAPSPKIYVTYGSKHIPGVYQILKADDPSWRVASVKWLRTIDVEESYTRQLRGLDLEAGL